MRELLAQEARHLAAALLVDDLRRLGHCGAVHGARVPGDGDTTRPIVGEQLEEHVREAEERVRRLAVRRLQLLGEREERPVCEVVAVDEEELGIPCRPVVELELRTRQRLRRHRLNAIVRAGMARFEILAFADEHLKGAAALLAERHARHRTEEPLLPDIADFREPVEREWRDGAGGAAALADGEVVGYLIGQRREDAVGPYVWSHVAGHAVRTPEVTRDLYRVASGRWVEEGLTRHFVFAPALPDLIEPWFRLSFGASGVLAMRETGAQPAIDDGVVVRRSSREDLEAAAALDRVLGEHLLAPPSFGAIPVPAFRDYVDEWRATWEEEKYTHFVAERDGRIVGHALLYRRPADLRVPADSIDLANAATDPGSEARGSGSPSPRTSSRGRPTTAIRRWSRTGG